MDIPQLPGEITIKLSPTSPIQKLGLQHIVPLEQLNLIPNKTYQGHALSPLSEFLSQIQTPSPQTEKSAINKNNWLILLQGKLINVLSERPLQQGQQLNIKLQATGLLLEAFSTQRNTATSQNPASVLDTREMSALVKGVNQLISNQLPLAKGFSLLSQMASTDSGEVISKQASTVLATLAKALPNKESLLSALPQAGPNRSQNSTQDNPVLAPKTSTTPTNLAPSNTPTQLEKPSLNIKQTLNNSGIFFERQLIEQKSNLQALENSIKQVSKHIQQELGVNNQAATNNNAVQTQTPPSKPSLKATIKTLLASHTSNTNNPTQAGQVPSSSLSTSNQQNISNPNIHTTTDLKALVLSVASSLSQTTNQIFSLDGLNDPELLQMPFNFPPAASNQILKAESILADQELTTGQLLKLLAGILNRLQFNQLNSLYQSQTASAEPGVSQQSWFFELPIANGQQSIETFNLRIDKEAKDNSNEQEGGKKQEIQWKVALSFNFDELGDIYIQTLITPPVVSSTIWANKSSTLALINKEQPHLRQRLSDLGLEVGDIICQYGQPKTNKAKLDRNLVDITA